MKAAARTATRMQDRGHLYCLRCLAGLPAGAARSTRCPRCGFVNRASDRRIYWNRNPLFRFVEVCLKVCIAGLVALLCFLLATNLPYRGSVSGWTVVPPLFLGVLLWQTASKLTRHDAYWRPATAWIAMLLLLAVFPLLLYLFQPGAGDRFTPGQLLRIESVLLGIAVLVHVAARLFAAWKRSLLHRGAPHAATRNGGAATNRTDPARPAACRRSTSLER